MKSLVQLNTSDFPRRAVGIGSARVSTALSMKTKAINHAHIGGDLKSNHRYFGGGRMLVKSASLASDDMGYHR